MNFNKKEKKMSKEKLLKKNMKPRLRPLKQRKGKNK